MATVVHTGEKFFVKRSDLERRGYDGFGDYVLVETTESNETFCIPKTILENKESKIIAKSGERRGSVVEIKITKASETKKGSVKVRHPALSYQSTHDTRLLMFRLGQTKDIRGK